MIYVLHVGEKAHEVTEVFGDWIPMGCWLITGGFGSSFNMFLSGKSKSLVISWEDSRKKLIFWENDL